MTNITGHNAQVAHWLKNPAGNVILPAQVDIDLTNKCNQDCFYCNSAEFREREPVHRNYEIYIDLIEKISKWRHHSPNSVGSTNCITFPGGGEPTLLKHYERVIEYAIDCGFLVSLTTNGSNLDKLATNVSREKLELISWIGVDIDSADPITYEKIRKSKTKNLFKKVTKNIKMCTDAGATVDLKFLLSDYNSSKEEFEKAFEYAQNAGVRLLYFRPTIFYSEEEFSNKIFNITDEMISYMETYSNEYNIPYKVSTSKSIKRNYKRCHQMFQFPVFCADGKIYSCCDSKGDPRFEIGTWDAGDFRNEWLGEKHMEVYNKTIVELCPPCRGNVNNVQIQDALNDKSLIETLNT
jgi:molybdenum cofactor biosynthesis enzyme MoaA